MKKLFLLCGLVFAITGAVCAQLVLRVPNDYSSIQAALNAATEGDTVLVAPGRYTENIIWPSTGGIKLISRAGSDSTTIDGNRSGSAISIRAGEVAIDASTQIKGFHITGGGSVENGGGLYINGASPLFEDIIVSGNRATRGAGIYCSNGSEFIMRDVVVRENVAIGNGGGFYITESNPLIINSIVTENRSLQDTAGGIYTLSEVLWVNHHSYNNVSTETKMQ